MSENSVKDILLSRKKVTTSIRRHFSSWKERIFELDQLNHRLHVQSKQGSPSVTFDLLVCSISRDNCIVDSPRKIDDDTQSHSLFLTFSEKSLEIVVKFRDIEHQSFWENIIFRVAVERSDVCVRYSRLLSLLCEFIRDHRRLVLDQLNAGPNAKMHATEIRNDSSGSEVARGKGHGGNDDDDDDDDEEEEEEEGAECYQGRTEEGFSAALTLATGHQHQHQHQHQQSMVPRANEFTINSDIGTTRPPVPTHSTTWQLLRGSSVYLSRALSSAPSEPQCNEFEIIESEEDDFAIVDISRAEVTTEVSAVHSSVVATHTTTELATLSTSELKELTQQLGTFGSLHIRRDGSAIDAVMPSSTQAASVRSGDGADEDINGKTVKPIFDHLASLDRPIPEEHLIVTDPFANLTTLRNTKQAGLRSLLRLPEPSMNVLIMVVGTRGDVQPFLLIARKLQRRGHRVRLATHAAYRTLVTSNGLEFYPLAGDPQRLSDFMVRSQGCVVPLSAELLREIPQHLVLLNEIVESCWDACIMPDPLTPSTSFRAQAIIANPVAYGHTHCAEALNIPLHLMFPQPWLPTKAFPHPLSCLSYRHRWSADNRLSYQLVDAMIWMTLQVPINLFRAKKLGLPPLPKHRKTAVTRDVPFVKMWSPELVPKPKDWPAHVDIVGTFIDHERAVISDPADIIAPTLTSECDGAQQSRSEPVDDTRRGVLEFLKRKDPTATEEERPTLFIGFGSMMIDRPTDLVRLLIEAVAVSCPRARVIVQSGWTALSQAQFNDICTEAEKKARFMRGAHSCASVATIAAPSAVDASLIFSSPSHSKHPGEVKDGECSLNDRSDNWTADQDALLIGPCDHNWLFPLVSAAIHHGGAGTTAAALAAGKPAWILPFFGDQHFWGEMVRRRALGPDPCPVGRVTFNIATQAISILLSPETLSNAAQMGRTIGAEDGATGAVSAFLRQLPVRNLMCHVSLFAARSALAEVYCSQCGFKMSRAASAVVHAHPARQTHVVQPYAEYHISSTNAATHFVTESSKPSIQAESDDGISEDELVIALPIKATEGNQVVKRKDSTKEAGNKSTDPPSNTLLQTVQSVVNHVQRQSQEVLPAGVSLALKIGRSIQKSWRGGVIIKPPAPRMISPTQPSADGSGLDIAIYNDHKVDLRERDRAASDEGSYRWDEGSQTEDGAEARDGVFYGRDRSTSHTLSQGSNSFNDEADSELDFLFEEVSDCDASFTGGVTESAVESAETAQPHTEEEVSKETTRMLYNSNERRVERARRLSGDESLLHPAVLALQEALMQAVRERGTAGQRVREELPVHDSVQIQADAAVLGNTPMVEQAPGNFASDVETSTNDVAVGSSEHGITTRVTEDLELLEAAFLEATLCRLVMQSVADSAAALRAADSPQRALSFPFPSLGVVATTSASIAAKE